MQLLALCDSEMAERNSRQLAVRSTQDADSNH